jgi:hypothetical protein
VELVYRSPTCVWINVKLVDEELVTKRGLIQKHRLYLYTNFINHSSAPLNPFEVVEMWITKIVVISDSTFKIQGGGKEIVPATVH